MANQHCAIWHIDRIQTFPWPRIDCRTGGTHKCVDGVCPHGN
jgi:hypothetical protein